MKLSKGKLAALIIVLVIVIDQAVKIWVKTHFYYGEELEITSWFRLLFIENNGMAFGMELGSKAILTWLRISPVYRIRDGRESLSRNEEIFNTARRATWLRRLHCLDYCRCSGQRD